VNFGVVVRVVEEHQRQAARVFHASRGGLTTRCGVETQLS
jgi:hypothetical protein